MELTEHQSGHGCLQMNTQHMVKVNSDIVVSFVNTFFHSHCCFLKCVLLFFTNLLLEECGVRLFLFYIYLFGSLSIDI